MIKPPQYRVREAAKILGCTVEELTAAIQRAEEKLNSPHISPGGK